jgi:hypothetical protein
LKGKNQARNTVVVVPTAADVANSPKLGWRYLAEFRRSTPEIPQRLQRLAVIVVSGRKRHDV